MVVILNPTVVKFNRCSILFDLTDKVVDVVTSLNIDIIQKGRKEELNKIIGEAIHEYIETNSIK